MVQVIWTERALKQLSIIRDFISTDSVQYAERFCIGLTKATRKLTDFPRCGHVVPEFNDENIREIPYYPYRIIYKIVQASCCVTAVIHGSRDLKSREWPERWEV